MELAVAPAEVARDKRRGLIGQHIDQTGAVQDLAANGVQTADKHVPVLSRHTRAPSPVARKEAQDLRFLGGM